MPAPITTRGSGRAATVPAGIGYPKRLGPTGHGRPAGGCSSSGLQGRKHERPGSPRRSNRRLRRHTLRHMPTPVIASLGHRNL
ncbi:hypothetical protein SEA_SRISHMEG2525_15 [Mycobacterium phage SrishMeg2525]|nr:hypothetical protein SEA_SRISHMEG2525_15 [Mycobacterium phage SrishMeg2525]